jgi:hypothetical protein
VLDQGMRLGSNHRMNLPRTQTLSIEETTMNTSHDDDATAPVPWMQQLLDNPFLLLFLGVMIPMVVYTVWGVFDILTLPVAK